MIIAARRSLYLSSTIATVLAVWACSDSTSGLVLDAGSMSDASTPDDTIEALIVPPLLFSPTSTSISVNAVVDGDRESLSLEFRNADEDEDWIAVTGETLSEDVIEWHLTGLEAATEYVYRIISGSGNNSPQIVYSGAFATRPKPGSSFVFNVLTDSHVFARKFDAAELEEYPINESQIDMYLDLKASAEKKLPIIANNMSGDLPDFIVHLGDMIDFHGFGFNDAPPDSAFTRQAYLAYRELMDDLLGNTFHFSSIGNWEGENGYFSKEEIERSRSQRLLYMPTPDSTTYPQGAGSNNDYYAFDWGDAMFVVLNVMSYTPLPHLLEYSPGTPTDWTLGEDQLLWLSETLEQSSARWKIICIHHTVGGNGGDYDNSVYGRGGGRAANVGEQAIVHQLMQDNNVQIFFYGHDHVFVDMEVDGVHYTLPGSAGAPWTFETMDTGYETFWPDTGYARVNVTPTQLTVEFVSLSGETIHSYLVQ
jgi:Calcineurin-like phosphoesterase